MTDTGAAAAQPMPGTGHASSAWHPHSQNFFLALPVQRTAHARKRMPAEKIRQKGKHSQACRTSISFLGQMRSTRYNAGHLLDTAGYFSAAPFGPDLTWQPRRIAFTNAQNSARSLLPACSVLAALTHLSNCSSTLTAPPLTAAPLRFRQPHTRQSLASAVHQSAVQLHMPVEPKPFLNIPNE